MKPETTQLIGSVQKILARQAELMIHFGEQQQELQETVLARDWATLEALIPAMERTSHEAATLDGRRHELINQLKASLGVHADATFAELLEHLPENHRDELGTLFRDLQVAVLRVKSLSRGIDSYVRGSLRTSNEVLGAVFPDQKGTLYSRRGRKSPADGRAMVLDQHL